MIGDHDRALLEQLRAARTTATRVAAEAPDAVARALAEEPGVVLVEADELERLVALARRVGAAEEVVSVARSFERDRAARVAAELAGPPADTAGTTPVFDLDASPAVRAAAAHLRRQQAAWKVAWWARGQPVPELPRADGPPLTVVCVDPDRSVPPGADATMTAAGAAVIRVVLIEPRA